MVLYSLVPVQYFSYFSGVETNRCGESGVVPIVTVRRIHGRLADDNSKQIDIQQCPYVYIYTYAIPLFFM